MILPPGPERHSGELSVPQNVQVKSSGCFFAAFLFSLSRCTSKRDSQTDRLQAESSLVDIVCQDTGNGELFILPKSPDGANIWRLVGSSTIIDEINNAGTGGGPADA